MDRERRRALGVLYYRWEEMLVPKGRREPTGQLLRAYGLWAEELVLGGDREESGREFRRFCRLYMEAQVYELSLAEVAKDYRSGRLGPDPEDWPCLEYKEGLDGTI